ncbi:putative metal-nicotianamine transporter YSL7 [Abeliophyllum distichum]|uniref:Metal-nicotianamine transporter YSL7 n=1 Tax=Abeliophyllum distichum TaxID=126358 RepID=A0ABD1V900_9LAMI
MPEIEKQYCVAGGFRSYLFAMSKQVVKQSEQGQDGFEYKNPELGWIIGFLFVVSFLGLFSLVPLCKIIMIIDFKLTYPSGTATALLINSFHTPEGAKLAKTEKQCISQWPNILLQSPKLSYDEQSRTQLFVKDQIPTCLAIRGYVAISAVSTASLPHIFHQLKWYHIIIIYKFAPVLAFCNAFGCGLTDCRLMESLLSLQLEHGQVPHMEEC